MKASHSGRLKRAIYGSVLAGSAGWGASLPAMAGEEPASAVKLPPAYRKARNNLSMESLTKNTVTGRAWTAAVSTAPPCCSK